ncbi:MAG TPA: monovalent cation/H(+) antiporter subunit G [Methylomirabilota bacterium]|nr:monovalent cation/H(+) antiporter subunit G [Methylomirabilota bacterium]
MTAWGDAVAIGLICAGVALMLVGSLGIVRLPDFYCRTHAASKVDTLGIMVVLFGLAVYEGWTLTAGKMLVAAGFLALTNPVAVHALARAALRFGVQPWFPRDAGKGGTD